MTPEAKRGAMHPPMPEDVRRGLHKPQLEKHPHTVRKIVAGTLAAAGIIAYANFSDDVNKFVNGIFTGPFPNITEAATPTPTEINDGLIIPEGLAVEDKQLRENVRLMIREGNAFGLDVAEVKNYLATGEATDLKTFEVVKDAEGKAAFVIVKGGNNGFDENNFITLKDSIEKMNKIDSTITRTLVNKNTLRFVSTDINNIDFFGKNRGYTAKYFNHDFGGVILINPGCFKQEKKMVTYTNISSLIVESRALYFLSKNNNPSDKLSDNIGIDKGMYLSDFSKSWFNNGKIDAYGKECLDIITNSIISFYSQN